MRFKLFVGNYAYGGSTAVQLICADDDECFATLSVNVDNLELPPGEFVFKTYSENEGYLEDLIAVGIVERTGREVAVGMAGFQPVCRLLPIDTDE